MTVYYASAVQQARMSAVVTQAGSTAVLEIGTAGLGAGTGIVLATFTLDNPIGSASGGQLTLSGFPKAATIVGNGTAAEARIRTASGGTDVLTGLTVGTSGNSDIVLSSTTLQSGKGVRISSLVLQTFGMKYGCNCGGMELAHPRYGASTRPNLNVSVPRANDLKYLASCGFSRIRLPVSWEMLQPVLTSSTANSTVMNGYNPALTGRGALYTRYRDWITNVLDSASAAGMTVIIDLHNYFRYTDFVYQADGSVIGYVAAVDAQTQPYTSDSGQVTTRIASRAAGATLTTTDFADIWAKIATYWGQNWNGTGAAHPGLGGYELMNEPNTLPAVGSVVEGGNPEDLQITPTFMQAAINAIRAVDTVTPIYVGGNGWQATFSWASMNPGFPLTGTNLIYAGHCYLDHVGNSGTGALFDWPTESSLGVTTNTGSTRLQPFVDWCIANRVKGAITEIGMPIGNDNWTTTFINAMTTVIPKEMEVYTWVGGNAFSYRAYPINHVPQWYQNQTLEPEVSGALKNVMGIQQCALFVDGNQYALNGSLAVQAVTIRVCARGNTATGVSLTVSSNNGGTFSATSLTIAAGANKSTSFTFTPATTNSKTTLSFTVSSPTGLAAPNSIDIYTYTDPVTLSATNLPNAAATLMAKYQVAHWQMADAYTDFMFGTACTNGGIIRAVSDRGMMSKWDNPMEMLNWYNTDAVINSYMFPPTFGTDAGSKNYAEFNSSNNFGLWCHKVVPSTPAVPTPQQRVLTDINTNSFALVAFTATASGATGPLLFMGAASAGDYIEMRLDSGQPSFKAVNGTGGLNGQIFGTAPSLNTVTILSMTSTNSGGTYAQTFRQQAALKGSGAVSLGTAAFDSYMLGGNSVWDWHSGVTSTRIYGGMVGVGQPSTNELNVLEKYLSSLSGGSL